MKTKLAVSVFAAAGLMLASCGKNPVKDLSQRAEYHQLMNTWGGKCAGVGSEHVGVSSQTFWKFSGADFIEQKEFYNSGDCKDGAVAYIKYMGTFELEGDSQAVPGAKQIHLRYTNVDKVAVKPDLKKVVDAAPVKKVPGDEYNLVKVVGDALYFGNLGVRQSAPTPDKRPTDLSKESFGKTEHVVK